MIITTNVDEIRAVLQLVQRTPMTRAEALFTEALFSRWLDQLAQPGATPGASASAADVLDAAMNLPSIQPPADQHIGKASEAARPGAPSSKRTDLVQST